MKTLVTYNSKTGFTEKYAEWISQELSCDMKEISKVTAAEVNEASLVIHGGWIMGGMISGLDRIRKLKPRKLIVFGVGFTDKQQTDIKKTAEVNKLDGVPFFYYEGGMNPDKMGAFAKMTVKMVTKKTPEYSDHTNKDNIEELVKLAAETV